MPYETSKSMMRRLFDRRYCTTYFVGDGIDIGCGPDPVSNYGEMNPLMRSCRLWDKKDGDATFMEGIEDEKFDFVHSSHCLEHLQDPVVAMKHWIRITKKGGHILLLLPDEDLFEQGFWPSRYSGEDHKNSWTIGKLESWCPASMNLLSFLQIFLGEIAILKIELLDNTFFYHHEPVDQTRFPLTESAIEVILRRKTDKERVDKGRLPPKPNIVFKYDSNA